MSTWVTTCAMTQARQDDTGAESQSGEALAALRVMTNTVDDQTRQLSDLSHQLQEKEQQVENVQLAPLQDGRADPMLCAQLMNKLSAAERDRDLVNNKLASMEVWAGGVAPGKAEWWCGSAVTVQPSCGGVALLWWCSPPVVV